MPGTKFYRQTIIDPKPPRPRRRRRVRPRVAQRAARHFWLFFILWTVVLIIAAMTIL